MASGGTSSSKPTPPVSLSPVTAVLADLFGVGTTISNGGIQLAPGRQSVFGRSTAGYPGSSTPSGGGGGGSPFGNMPGPFGKLFGGERKQTDMGLYNYYNQPNPNATLSPGDFASVRDLLNPIPLQGFESGTAGVGNSALDLYNNQGLPALRELLSTGFRTNMDPIRANEMMKFKSQTVPGLAEQFAGQTGTFSTDFLGAITNAGSALHSELGALQAQMDEAASGRRADAISGGALNLPAEFGTNLLTLGEQLRLQTQGASAGGQSLALLQALSGVVPTGAVALSPKQKSAQGGVL